MYKEVGKGYHSNYKKSLDPAVRQALFYFLFIRPGVTARLLCRLLRDHMSFINHGAGAKSYNAGVRGAVRIIWGHGRSYPSNEVDVAA